ncbi:MAG: SpoIIE family protein phosphatase [Magnetococcales bacterium]|nr:SpoIIE family protein phosphatase [Magnetococcales bacterium]
MSYGSTKKPIILVVDDIPENIDVLKGSLAPQYIVRPALNGQTALKAAQVRPHPDLILLDIMMPVMDGYDVCRQLKSNPETREIPIIFITAKSGESDEIEGLQLGAVDYITKPFSIPIVLSRVKTHIALQTAKKLVESQNRRLTSERQVIETIILKMRGSDTFDERHIRYLISPVEQTAGDLLLSLFTPDGRQLILLGDFTGHGLPAAIGGPLVTYILHQMANRSLSGEDIFQEINSQLFARMPSGLFFAATLVEVSLNRTKARLWNAGLPNTLLVRNGKLLEQFPSKLPPLGILQELNLDITVTSLELKPADRLYIFSDGIIEAHGKTEALYGLERLIPFLEQSSQTNNPLTDLLPLLETHIGSASVDDDVTLVEVQF